ncbi:hypothetical protein UNSWDHB_637 [Dehalobacter sp. UNSWDHB]|nr:hypothetical protein UNSWDHB_637 [Dehalobacter sp. UNSWDHB]
MNAAISQICRVKNDSEINCLVLNFDDEVNSPQLDHVDEANKNLLELYKILGKEKIQERKLEISSEGQKIRGRRATELFPDEESLGDCTDVVVDISAMPRSTYFPLINQLIKLCHKRNLHVVVAENFWSDAQIRAEELDENADYMFTFSGEMQLVVSNELPVVWFPVFGEGKEDQLRIIYKTIQNNLADQTIEICPILPFPAKNPRRVDDIIAEYHQLLIEFGIEPRNIIYADEQNPFDVYRQIREASILYDEAFGPLGGCRKVVSALSSKLLSLGALISAHEGSMAVAYVESHGYIVRSDNTYGEVADELHEIWLVGEPYE